MRTKHSKYSNLLLKQHCYGYNLFGHSYTFEHEQNIVKSVCKCGELLATFYRIPERETERVMVDVDLIRKSVTVDRIVSWVGYAKNPHTILLEYDAIQDKMKQLWKKSGGQDEYFKYLNWRLEKGLQQWAKYELRRDEYKTGFRNRAFWFTDKLGLTAIIEDIASCYTGHAVSSSYDSYYRESEPGYLDGQQYHRLYCARVNGWPVLIHPSDIK